MVALVVSTLALVAGIFLVFAVGRRRPPGTPVTWGEAFVGGTFIFALFMLAYGIIPHQWLTFADNQLLWRPDKLMLGISGDGVKLGDSVKDLGGTGRIIVNCTSGPRHGRSRHLHRLPRHPGHPLVRLAEAGPQGAGGRAQLTVRPPGDEEGLKVVRI